jgi:glycosyltransferase involved in cell wall biosynthesis
MYAGLHGVAQGLDQLVEAARLLRDLPGFRLVLVGDGPEKERLVAQAAEQGLANVSFLPSVPASAMPDMLRTADVAVAPLKSAILGAVPSKLYEAMAMGLPVVVVADGGPADIVQRHDAGLAVPPGDPSSLARALRTFVERPELRQRMGSNGRRAAEAQYDRRAIMETFISTLETAPGARPPGR